MEKILVTKVEFTPATGTNAYGGLIESSNGKLYGMTAQGGLNDKGVLFEYNPSDNSYSDLIHFDGTILGRSPVGRLTESTTPNLLYGMTSQGGTSDKGTIFSFGAGTNTFTKVYDFGLVTVDGFQPMTTLELANNGKFYSMTNKGGVNDIGILFEFDPTNDTYTKRIDFDQSNGRIPSSELTNALGDVMYGLSTSGGDYNGGTLFEYNTVTHVLTKKVDLNSSSKGAVPYGYLTLKNGMYYGITSHVGYQNGGVIFQFDPVTGDYTVKLELESISKGANPYGNLFEASDGKLYGVTKKGGVFNKGTLYQFDPITNEKVVKVNFKDNLGTFPGAGLIEPITGKLYGVAVGGGAHIEGSLFEYDITTEVITVKASFNNTGNGGNPFGLLLKGADGHLYGTTFEGGDNELGTVYRYNLTTKTITKLVDFDGATMGQNPRSGLIEVNNVLYGVTVNGGTNDDGVLFEYNLSTNTFAKKMDFDNVSTGRRPFGRLVLGTSTELFGTTFEGGVSDKGTLFKFDISNDTYTKIADFDGLNNGQNPLGALSLNVNGKLYGATNSGGTHDGGLFYELDPTTNAFIVKYEFSLFNGIRPRAGLVEFCRKPAYTVPEVLTYTVCVGEELTVDLMSGNSDSYIWKKDGTTHPLFTNDSISFTSIVLTDAGTYQVEMTNVCGVTTAMPIVVNISSNTLPSIGITAIATGTSSQSNANEISICKGAFLTLKGTGATSYTWDNEVVNGQLFIPTVSETYTVKGSDANNCSATFSLLVNVNDQPNVTAQVDLSTVCQGQEIILNGSGADSYTWSHGVVNNTPHTLQTSTSFTVEGTASNGCKNTAGITVTAYLKPVVGLSATDLAVCQGGLVTLIVSGNAVLYQLNKGISGVPFTLLQSEKYTVIATSAENCISKAEVDLVAYALPIVTIVPHNDNICSGEEIVFSGDGADTYTWNHGVVDGVPFTVNNTTNFSVIGTETTNGCQAFATTSVTVDGCTGLDAIENSGISVYPNPFSTEVVINNEGEEISSLMVYSFDGNLIKTFYPAHDKNITINLRDLATGTYFVKINTTNSSYQVKMMKH